MKNRERTTDDSRGVRAVSRRALLRFTVLSAVGAVAAACARELPGWTYAPAPPTTPPPATPAAPAAPGSSPSSPPVASPQSPGAGVVEIRIVAQNIAFDLAEFSVPANTPFRIVFENLDAGVPHNVAIYQGQASGPILFQGDIFNGFATRTYEVPALPAGDHYFQCDVHPNMNGTVRVA